MHRIASILIASMLAGSCVGPLVLVTKVEESKALELQANVPVFSSANIPRTARALGPLTATSCKNKLWDAEATEADATNQLRLHSRNMGGNAVGNLTCEPPAGTSLSTNCWTSIRCHGTALAI